MSLESPLLSIRALFEALDAYKNVAKFHRPVHRGEAKVFHQKSF